MKKKRMDSKCNICPVVLGAEITDYLTDLERRRYSPTSIDVYRRALLDMDAFLGARGTRGLNDITADNLADYRLSLFDRGLKASSVVVYIRAVRGLFRWLEDRHRIFINPTVGLIVRTARQFIQYVPTEAEVRRLLAAPSGTPAGLRDRAVLEVAYATGARRAENASLTLDSVNSEDATLRIMGKGERERVVPLTTAAVGALARYAKDSRPKFPGADTDRLWLGQNGPLSPDGISYVFLRQCQLAGIKPVIRPHAMRRACATHMLRHGAGPVDIQHLLGHADLKHLSQYLAVSIREMKQAHEQSKLGR